MKSCHVRCLASLSLFFITSSSFAQNQRTFNQNASRSNRGLSISFSPVYSSAINSKNDSVLFRGAGVGFRFGADYFFGKAGIGFSSGFSSSSPDDASINKFLSRSPFPPDQLIVAKTKQQNMYLLFGPAIRFGKTIEFFAHAKGGLFINNSGLINIQQKGAQRSLYRNESTAKSIYPGFLSGLGVLYKTKSDIWSFGIGLDYLNTRTDINNYDARRGGAIEALKLSRNIADLVTGITVRYNILSPRDHASGQASGKRRTSNNNSADQKVPGDASSGLATGKRTYKPGQPVYGNLTSEGTANGNCGTVKQTITNADGSTEEMTFACPDDAANYNNKMKIDGGMPNRISMNVTVPKQTQGATFGEKVNAGLQAAGSAISQGTTKQGIIHRDIAARNIISGRLSWTSGNSTGIVTNKTVAVSSVSSLSNGSGAASASYAATGKMSNNTAGVVTTLYARERGSGMASGRRSRERGSGLSTGRRQYEPIFAEGQGSVCNPCIADVKIAGINNNPIYNGNGQAGNNPMHEGKAASDGNNDDSDGISGIMVSLIDAESGAAVAKTITEQNGDFFFANVPDGNYLVKLNGNIISKKGYDYYAAKSKTDLLGKVELGDASMQLLINTSNDNDDMTQKAGISTSRSNIRTKALTIIEADVDGDGEYESLSATGTFSDGTSQDISSTARKTISNASGTKGIVLEGDAMQMTRRRVEVLKSNKQGDPGANRIVSIAILKNGNRLTATGTFSDGSTRDVTEGLEVNTNHRGVKQYNIAVCDLDDDGIADAVIKTKTRSYQSNDRIANGKSDADDATEAVIKTKTKSNQSNDRIAVDNSSSDEEIWSPRSNVKLLRLATGDLDGDGIPEIIATSPSVPGNSNNTDAMRPGNPIGGLTIKGGKNPGGNLGAIQTNENGEFEFTNLEAGDYTFSIEQKIFIEDETTVVLGGYNTRVQDHNSSRSNKSSGIIAGGTDNGNMKVHDHNSSRSNKTGSLLASDPENDNTKVQDHNSSRSNKTSSLFAGGPEDGSTKVQDHNSSRSNKSASNLADDPDNENDGNDQANGSPVKWMAPESLKQKVNTSRTNIKNIIASLNELEDQLNIDVSNEKSLVNTSRNNIKNQRLMILELQEALNNMEYIDKEAAMTEVNRKITAMNTQFQALQQSITALGGQYSSISNVLKTRHDIALNAIRNMK
jgi:hypothetical protein